MHSNDESFYCLVLDDYAAPSFCSFGKNYFGSLELIEHLIHSIKVDRRYADDYKQLINTFKEYMAGNVDVKHNVAYKDVLFLEPVTIYAKENSVADFNKYEHLNVWGYPYYLRWNRAESNHIWLKYGNSFVRCIKTVFYNLEECADIDDEVYRPMHGCMGFPKQIEIKDEVVTNTLYVTEKVFEDEKELLEDVERFRNSQDPLFERIFEDIFGDG